MVPDDAAAIYYSSSHPAGIDPTRPGRAGEAFHYRAVMDDPNLVISHASVRIGGQTYRRHVPDRRPSASSARFGSVRPTTVYVLERCAKPGTDEGKDPPEGFVRCDGRVTSKAIEVETRRKLHALAEPASAAGP